MSLVNQKGTEPLISHVAKPVHDGQGMDKKGQASCLITLVVLRYLNAPVWSQRRARMLEGLMLQDIVVSSSRGGGVEDGTVGGAPR
jgi:hypothetical protein